MFYDLPVSIFCDVNFWTIRQMSPLFVRTPALNLR